jgi:hypothetical protein
MTDRSRDPGRIDLRAIDEAADPQQADRVIAAAMSRVAAQREAPGDVLASLVVYWRPLLAVAAVLLLAATGTLVLTRGRTQTDQPVSVVASWAESSHVPTNGELLAAFQGYGR